MATGAAWDLTDPKHPVAEWDKDDVLDVPLNWNAWLADKGLTYSSHEILGGPMFEDVHNASPTTYANGYITPLMRVAAGQSPVIGQEYQVVCRIHCGLRQADRSFWLKIVER